MRPLRLLASACTITILAAACSSSGSGEPGAVGFADPTTVVEINIVATELIDEHGIWPDTVDARRMSILHQVLYETWAVFDGEAAGTIPDSGHRRLAASFGAESIDEATNAAAYTVFEELYDDSAGARERIEAFGTETGTTDVLPGIQGPDQLGARIADMILTERRADGANEDFFYRPPQSGVAGTPGPQPQQWQPLTVPTGVAVDGDGKPVVDPDDPLSREGQVFETAQWGTVTPQALTSGDQYRPSEPPPRPLNRQSGDYIDELLSIARGPSELDESARAEVALWTDSSPVVTWNVLTRDLIADNALSGTEQTQLLFVLNAALHDAYVAAWDAKAAYRSPRPITEIQRLLVADEVADWTGEPTTIADWAPYQDPRVVTPASPAVVAEHAVAAASATTVLDQYLDGSVGFTIEVAAREADWTVGPAEALTLEYPSVEDAVAASVSASLDAGIVIEDEARLGRELGTFIGAEVYRQLVKLWI